MAFELPHLPDTYPLAYTANPVEKSDKYLEQDTTGAEPLEPERIVTFTDTLTTWFLIMNCLLEINIISYLLFSQAQPC